jgi:hypothetical protein
VLVITVEVNSQGYWGWGWEWLQGGRNGGQGAARTSREGDSTCLKVKLRCLQIRSLETLPFLHILVGFPQ